VTFALGIFDLFAYAIPGALQLCLLMYLGERLRWLDVHTLSEVPSGVLFVALVLASYLLGHLDYALGALFDRVQTRGSDRWRAARATFLARNPNARDRAFVDADLQLLLAAVELHAREVAAEISRLRAAGLMLRNSAVPLALGAFTAGVESALGPARVHAGVVAALLALATLIALRRSLRLRSWALAKTFELAFWIPDIDSKVRGVTLAPSVTVASESAQSELTLLEQALPMEDSRHSTGALCARDPTEV